MAYKESKLTDEGDSCGFSVAPIDYKFTRGTKIFNCWNWYDRMIDLKEETFEVLNIPKNAWKKHGKEYRAEHNGKNYIIITPRDDDFVLYQEQPRESECGENQKVDPVSERRLIVYDAIKALSRTCGKGGVPREALEGRLAGQMKDTDISRALIELGLGGLIDEPHRNQYVLRER